MNANDTSDEVPRRTPLPTSLPLRGSNLVPSNHPVWSHRPYKVFLYTPEDVTGYTPEDVTGRIDYVNETPEKEGLSPQHWAFVKECPFE